MLDLENARKHDIWKTIGFSIASVGFLIVTLVASSAAPYTAVSAVGAGLAAFGNGITIKFHENSIN